MNVIVSGRDDLTAWTTGRARWLIVAVHLAIIGVPPIITSFGAPGLPPTGSPVTTFPIALAILALQLRHSFAMARGERPRGAWWTLLTLCVLVYLPMHWYGWNWNAMQICVIASLPMVLRGRRLVAAAAVPVIGTDIVSFMANANAHEPISAIFYAVFYWTDVLIFEGLGMYGSARLARLLDELKETRAELAAVAIGRERLRISRDLHDLLGQSLSAISLKGDLAIRLLPVDPSSAGEQIQGLTALARDALRGILAVSRDEHTVSLRTETEGAVALLSAAGIDSQINLDLPDLAPPVEGMFAWTVREGVGNTLRHSQAHSCTIAGGRRDGRVFLEIVNDGARTPMADGSGLSGLSERAQALSGTASGSVTSDGQFRLVVEVPEGRP